ncbi:aegerolysin family protein [Kitasatospora sp. NPDC003701]
MLKIRTFAAGAAALAALALTAAPAQAETAPPDAVTIAAPVAASAPAPAAARPTAQRSTWVGVYNRTSKPLTLLESSGECWMENQAPQAIVRANGGSVMFASESCGPLKGTSGWADYMIGRDGRVHMTWNNPLVGANSYSCTVQLGDYSCERGGGSGEHAQVSFTITQN